MTILVSGGSKGLGLDLCKKILISNSEKKVITFARKESNDIKKIKKEYKERFFFYPFDMNETEKIYDFISVINEKHGPIKELVNNAAVGADGLLTTMHEKDIIRSVNINITSQILLTKYAARSMIRSRSGSIVNISSIVSKTGYNGLSVYAFAKAGQLGFTKSLSRELGKVGIKVNAVLPGFMETDMTKAIDQNNFSKIINRSPFKKLASTKDVAELIYFLLYESKGITGEEIRVDYGSTA